MESVWKKVVGEEESQSRTHWSRVGLELIGLMRRTTENLATSVCQVDKGLNRIMSSTLYTFSIEFH